MKLPSLLQFRVLKEAITALLFGPYTSKFPKEPSIPPEKFRGKPEYNKDECVGCGACAEVCPAKAIEVIDDVCAKKRKLTLHFDNCIFCGQCEANCTTEKGIKLGHEYDLALFDRKTAVEEQENELLLCESCGRIIGTKDHLLFVAKKLGPMAYANPLLVQSIQRDLELIPAEREEKITPPYSRSDIFKIICPVCRREVLLYDKWGK